jgi:hypothetical protein
VPWPSLLVVLVLGVASARVARLVGFFALAVAFELVPVAWRSAQPPEADDCTAARDRHVSPLAALATWAALVAIAIAIAGRTIQMDGPWLPEPEAAQFVERHALSGRMLTWFDYGEYAIWHFWPRITVSMDGRRETVYSERVRAEHFEAYAGTRAGLASVTAMAPDFAWLPKTSPAVEALVAQRWHVAFSGSRSVILARHWTAPPVTSSVPPGPRAFPGP